MVELHGPACFAVAAAVLEDDTEAERVVGETLALLIEQAEGGPTTFEDEAARLIRLVRLRAMSRRGERQGGRRRRRQERRLATEALHAEGAPGSVPDPGAALTAFQRLRPQTREVLSLSFFHGLRPPEVATRAGITESVARDRLRGGLAELQDPGAAEVTG